MLTKYIQAAMHRATYEILEDGSYYGEIEGFDGVYANADILLDCQQLLQEVLEGWLILGLRLEHSIPVIDDMTLLPALEVA